MKNLSICLFVLFLLYGVQHGTAQDDLAPLIHVEDDLAPLEHVQDDLAPLVYIKKSDGEKTVAYRDPSFLDGFQIRPEHSFLNVRQSKLLKVSDCFHPSFAGEDDLTSLLTECDPSGMGLAPLLSIAKTSKWSVNGIEGGNDRVGRIVANDNNTATYNAPAVKSSDETIQVSAEVRAQGKDNNKDKTLVVATITILDEEIRVYYGIVEIECRTPDVKYRAFGDILFKESGPNTDSFTSIGGTLGFSYDAKGCTALTGALPLHGELGLWTQEEDQLMAGGNTHGISFFSDSFNTKCNGVTIPQAIFSMVTTCDDKKNANNDIDYRAIWGEGTCGNVNIKWNLTKQ
jgi:hypothetical protein